MQDEAEVKAQEWLESTARLAGSHGVSFDQESMMRIGFENGYLAALRQRPVVDDAMVERALLGALGAFEALKILEVDKHLPGFDSTLKQIEDALATFGIAAYQQPSP